MAAGAQGLELTNLDRVLRPGSGLMKPRTKLHPSLTAMADALLQMTTFNYHPAAIELSAAEKRDVQRTAGGYLLLRPTGDGWSLMIPDGEVIYRGLGPDSRRRCLEIAVERGAATVLS